ncbi:MAG: transketolase [bacterium]|nr:MAG: transketolase [bacterium]
MDLELENTIINTIRTLSMDAVQKANSGHPGTPMALAPIAFAIYDEFLKFNPKNPNWPNRDRFVLSAGHASMLLYSVLHIMGYDVSLEDIQNFRQLHSNTAGHPEYGLTPGVEMTTGPLGQGAATSVGMAIAEKWLKTYFNRPGFDIIDYNILVIASDGCIMEGISHEAASIAGHLGLNNLIWIYDNNNITIEGKTELTFSEDVASRFKAYNWNVEYVDDANNLMIIQAAMRNAMDEDEKPSLIVLDSHIAYGAPNKQDTADAHGAPLGEDEIRAAKKNYGWEPDKKFHVPEEAKEYTEQKIKKGNELEQMWQHQFNEYEKVYPELAQQFIQIQNRELPKDWEKALPTFPADEKGFATRQSNGKVLNAIAEKIPWLIGGSADLMPSTKTKIENSTSFNKSNYHGRNFHFGIREHAMGAIVNGMALSKLRSYGATFFVFSDYMRPAIRLAALMGQPSIFIFTHDSIGLGEDGPTHQPVEQLASLRAMPSLEVIRPADANELWVLWKYILDVSDHPIALVLTRQAVPTLDRNRYASEEGALKGAYILADSNGSPDVILMGTGSEVHLCLAAYEELKKAGIKARVVSLPCWKLFERQTEEYKEFVLPEMVKARIAIEAGSKLGWEKYTGNNGNVIGLDSFGASAPYRELYREYGLTVENIIESAKKIIKRINF